VNTSSAVANVTMVGTPAIEGQPFNVVALVGSGATFSGGWEKSPSSFAEFRWAEFFRSRIPIGNKPGDFDRAIEAALQISHSPEAKDLPGYVPPD